MSNYRIYEEVKRLEEEGEEEDNTPLFPNAIVRLKLTGPEGNAFVILGQARTALAKAGATEQDLLNFTKEATSGDYENLLTTVGKWCRIL